MGVETVYGLPVFQLSSFTLPSGQVTQMRIAVMQPYFFPYLGYWQLIHSVDVFVVFDDVNFIKKG